MSLGMILAEDKIEHKLGFASDSHHIYRTCSCGGVMVMIDTVRFPMARWEHDHRMHVEDVVSGRVARTVAHELEDGTIIQIKVIER
jgi:hypothetical protein